MDYDKEFYLYIGPNIVGSANNVDFNEIFFKIRHHRSICESNNAGFVETNLKSKIRLNYKKTKEKL